MIKNMHKYATGKCMTMCPLEELKLREEENLLHPFEIRRGTENAIKPKADAKRAVKSFSRSAAGRQMQNENSLRPPAVLLKTITYLMRDIATKIDCRWHIVYEFIMDRLRAVRQDMVIQNLSRGECINILQPIVRFHAYAAYRLCNETLERYNPVINKTHLQECLKRLLCIYDDCEFLDVDKSNRDAPQNVNDTLKENRPFFEALYVIFNLGSTEAIRRALSLTSKWRTPLVKEAIALSLAYSKNNYVRTCRIMKKLPALLAAVASLHLPKVRRNCFKVMSVAYNSKILHFPMATLKGLLLYEYNDQLLNDCNHYGIEVKKEEILFNKTTFKHGAEVVKPVRERFVEEKLQAHKITYIMLSNK